MIENNKNFVVINDAFAHIGRKLKLFWGCPEFNSFIDELQTDTRGGTRAGFPGPVLNALFMLAMEHETAFPNLLGKQSDQWITTRRR
ncbi:MAG: hypothetical protein ACOYNZ_09995 [Rhodoferax sp.]